MVQDLSKEKLGKRFIKHTEWPPSSPDCYPLDPQILSSCLPLLEQNKRKSVRRPIQLTFWKLRRIKKKVWPEAAHDMTEIRKALTQFIPRLKAV